ncbi:hypothetical protein [Demequina capsici]|uniref:Uncharacterized protein n=1 Tax=Demequina capsici TaxID=3075620 RepID=A0AA96JD49_9MICO|nr:hypothetical protein [Demequina sp. OYTSA14]WNM24299.1 hypothetical protein RN606_13190 [Demequina sp. OYTSA14]
MEGLRRPVGRQSANVYWRRRLVVVLGVILLVVVAWFLIFSPSGDGTDLPAAESSQSPEATTSAAADASRACGVDDVTITVAAHDSSYAAGTLPVFDATITHTGSSACLLTTGGADSELLIMSGSDRIYSSADCPANSTITERDLLLSEGASESFQVTWDRQRSAEGSCDPVNATPGAGTYKATLTLQGISAEPATFALAE